MVNSILVPDIEYVENKALLPEDKNHEVSLYEITLYGKDEDIALGQPVYTFIERNLVYYPIYLVKNDKVTLQIGLYEVFADNIVNVLDADGDIELEKMTPPLLYGFTKEINEVLPLIEEASIEEANIETLKEQTSVEAEKEREQYTKQKGQHWLQDYFKNNNYRMIENEGKGDCLFAVIRDGLAKVGVYKSVDEMRKILDENVTEDIYQGYKTMFQDSFDTDAQLLKEIKVLVARHKELKKKIDSLKDRNEKQAVIIQADEIKQRHELAKRERAYTKSVVEGELKMMKNVHNVAQFKALIQTCGFWGDTWAISTLERVLNIKIILFSEESFKAGDLDNVLTCGHLNDTVLEDKGIFEPDYYILAIYLGYHYQLISYKDKGALTFRELPYDVKVKVVDKCLERLAGPYYIIPEFREFMEEKKDIETIKSLETIKLDSEPMQSDLFTNDTIFQFYSKSLDKPPGKGAGEIIPSGEINNYKDLKQITDWRRKLDNLWLEQFTLDGHKWNSVEHYYQGSKFKRGNPKFYLEFSVDSGSALSKDPEMAIGAGGKSGKYAKELIRPENVKIDKDFIGANEMESGQYAKFSQNSELKELLLATKNAKLQHFSRGSPPELFETLMRVRQRLMQTE